MVSSSTTPGQNQGPLGNEIKNMISTLSHHLNSISSSSSSSQQEQGHGNGIITLAGSNRGATMKSDMEHEVVDTHGVIYGDDERLSAYTNSNYQSINNSIVLGGSYTAEDPGIHLVISDFIEEHEDDHLGKHGNKEEDDEDEEDDYEKHVKKQSKKKNKQQKKYKKKESSVKEQHDSGAESEEDEEA